MSKNFVVTQTPLRISFAGGGTDFEGFYTQEAGQVVSTALNKLLQDYFLTQGVEIMAFYVCPHHWDDDCECRKPRAGLFYQCAKDYDLRLDHVLYIGDDPRDCEAAKAAGSNCLYVGEVDELANGPFAEQRVYSGIFEAVEDVFVAYGN
jgi:histidinol phosphatase-like enzyme